MNEFLNFAGRYKILSYVSCLLSALSALAAVLSLWYVWNIASCIIFSEGKEYISDYALNALIYAVVSVSVYIAGLICAHMAAFRISSNICLSPDVLLVPLKYITCIMPDSYFSFFSSVSLIALLFWSDWRLALVSIAPVVLGFVIMVMTTISGIKKKAAMPQKTSGSVICYTVAVNSAFLFLIAVGIGISRLGVSKEFLKNFMLAVFAAPLLSIRLTHTIRLREHQLELNASLKRIKETLNLKSKEENSL